MIWLLIFYLIGALIAFIIVFTHIKKYYLYITLIDALLMLAGVVASWITIVIFTLTWLYENGDDIVIFRFHDSKRID